jgi:hypothetical protein
MGQGTPMFYDQAILIQWLKEWDGRPARLFCFIRYGRERPCHSDYLTIARERHHEWKIRALPLQRPE